MAARQMDHGMPAVVSPPAEIDLTNAQEVFDQIYAALEAALTTVIVDLTATTFCDSSGIRHLLLAHRKADASGTQLRFAVPAASPVRRIFAFTGADQVVAVYPTLGEAISGSPAPAQPGSLGGAAEEPAQPMAKLCVLRRSHPRLRERRSAPASAAAARPT